MSLVNRIRWTILLMLVVSFAASLLIGTQALRQVLHQQLVVKNIDNANALALSLSQISKDPVSLSLLVSAQFDTGHYRFIRLVSADGHTMAERVFDGHGPKVPSWFSHLLAMDVPPGVAQIQDGWKPFGTLTLASHEQFVYETLWDSVQKLVLGFAAALAAAAALASMVVQRITAPLMALVGQVRALSQRRFVSIDPPRVRELQDMAKALNQAVHSVQSMFAAEAGRIDALQRQLNFDRVTGLPVREQFLGHISRVLEDPQQPAAGGTLLIVHFNDLAALNRDRGRPAVDRLLRDVAVQLESAVASIGVSTAACGQLNGSDLALLLPGELQSQHVAQSLLKALEPCLASGSHLLRIGAARYVPADSLSAMLTRVDEAVSRADPANGLAVLDSAGGPRLELGMQAWRQILVSALGDRSATSIRLYPVRQAQGWQLLHQEAYARISGAHIRPENPSQAGLDLELCAADFIPMAARLGLAGRVDLRVAELALEHLGRTDGLDPEDRMEAQAPVAINLSPDSLIRLEFRQGLRRLLEAHPGRGRRLLVEVPHPVVTAHPEAFAELALALQALGVGVGIDFFGLRLDPSARIETLGLQYVKLHPDLLSGLEHDGGQREVLARICSAIRGVGIAVYAQGVTDRAQINILEELGVQGFTGPGVG